jgi:Tol biopolymer transport system component
MTRLAALAGVVLMSTACTDSSAPPGPEPRVVVDDSLGTIVGGGILSPDGTRLAFARTVAGKSAIWVSAADGSNQVQLSHGVWDWDPWWSPDGRWIAYHSESPDYDVLVVSVDGGEPKLVVTGPAVERPRGWLADGSAVLVARSGQGDEVTLVAPLNGDPPRRLGPPMAGNQHVAFSPDQTRLAFDVHQGGGDATIWVQDGNGGEPRQLTTENLENAAVPYMWSPDGKFVAYTSRRTGTRDIYIADVSSGESRQLTNDVRDDYQARWSPDGKWIAFLSDRGGQTDLWVVLSAGGNATRVTNDLAIEVNPRWSPDGRSLMYTRSQGDVELAMMPSDGGAARRLLSWPGYGITSAVLSPDDNTVLFSSDRSGNADVWSIPVSGGEPVPFAASPLADDTPIFSPDGSQVLFRSDRAGSSDLWVVAAAGGEPRQLTDGPSNEAQEAWSPDGKSILFASDRGGAGGDLWVVPAAGGEPTRLTHDNVRPVTPEWSPDGRQIFYAGERAGGGRDIYRIPASGGKPQPLGANRNIGNSHLSKDGSQLSYSSFEGGWAFVDVIPATGGTPRRLTTEKEYVFQPWTVWSPDGAYLLVHNLDLEGNRDLLDLWTVQLSDGTWKQLTRTARASETLFAFTKDGKQMLVGIGSVRNEIMTIPVADLLATAAP